MHERRTALADPDRPDDRPVLGAHRPRPHGGARPVVHDPGHHGGSEPAALGLGAAREARPRQRDREPRPLRARGARPPPAAHLDRGDAHGGGGVLLRAPGALRRLLDRRAARPHARLHGGLDRADGAHRRAPRLVLGGIAMTRTLALIAGIGEGLGASQAEAFAAAGHDVLGLALRGRCAVDIAERVARAGGHYTHALCDLTNADQVAGALRGWEERVEVFVYNAHILLVTPFAQTTTADFEKLWRIGCLGAAGIAS